MFDRDVNEVFTIIDNTMESMKTVLVRQKDDQTRWLDVNEDGEMPEIIFTQLILKAGITALLNWELIRDRIEDDCREDIEKLMAKLNTMEPAENEE